MKPTNLLIGRLGLDRLHGGPLTQAKLTMIMLSDHVRDGFNKGNEPTNSSPLSYQGMDPANIQCSMGCKLKKVTHGFLAILLSNCVFLSSSAATHLLSVIKACILESEEVCNSVCDVLGTMPCVGKIAEGDCADDIRYGKALSTGSQYKHAMQPR